MIERKIGEFKAVPHSAVTLNGHYLKRWNTASEPYSGNWALVAPNGRAVDGEDGRRPYIYTSIEDATEDANRLTESDGYSTCGGNVH